MSIPDAIIEEIRGRADLVEIVAEHTRLKRSGKTFRGPCPLHGGEGPNFSVDPARNLFKCFVCGEGGDLFSFPMKHLGMGFTEAVRWVADRVGVVIPEREARDPEDEPNSELFGANAFASEWFRSRLLDPEVGREAREYLERRGIRAEVCERFGIGWAPEAWAEFGEAARKHGIDPQVLLALGLLKQSTRSGREPYDAFRGRVIFPIENLSGRVVAFGGRVIGQVEEHVPKYLNSPESPVYHKGDLLYGLRWTRGAIRKEEVALVVEGYMDFISLVSHGVENVVAGLGTALTQQQSELIARYAPRVILLYDSDPAGLKATFRAGDELLRAGVEVMVATLPRGEDPDSLVRRGGAPLVRRYLADAVDVLERKIQILERKGFFSSIARTRRAVDTLLPTIRAASDEVLRGLYIARVAARTGVPRETLEREVEAGDGRSRGRPREQVASPGARHSNSASRAQQQAPSPAPRLGPERNLVLLLLRDEQWLERAAERLGAEDFRDPAYRLIFEELVHLHAEGGRGEGSEWLANLPEAAAERAQDLLDDPEGWNLVHPDRFFEENMRELEARNQRERLASFNTDLERAGGEQDVKLLAEKWGLRSAMEKSGLTPRPRAARPHASDSQDGD
jgi:DNA primase